MSSPEAAGALDLRVKHCRTQRAIRRRRLASSSAPLTRHCDVAKSADGRRPPSCGSDLAGVATGRSAPWALGAPVTMATTLCLLPWALGAVPHSQKRRNFAADGGRVSPALGRRADHPRSAGRVHVVKRPRSVGVLPPFHSSFFIPFPPPPPPPPPPPRLGWAGGSMVGQDVSFRGCWEWAWWELG